MRKSLKIFALIFLAFCLNSCNKNNKSRMEGDTLLLEILPSSVENLVSEPQFWHESKKKVCVLFGYDYNSPEVLKKILPALEERYGFAENGGLIYPLIYPESFRYGERAYVSSFYNELTDVDMEFCGLVLLGAPDRTNVVLGRNKDFWKQDVPYSVMALFPQDEEVDGIASCCDIVIDRIQNTDLAGDYIEENENFYANSTDLVIGTIDYVLAADGPLNSKNLKIHASQMLNGRKIYNYVDPDCGLTSDNHFLIR